MNVRAWLFQKLLSWLGKKPRTLYSRLQLQLLLWATARGFQQKGRWILWAKDPLEAYAAFTKACMQKTGDHDRLFQVSYQLGKRIRTVTGFRRQEDLQRLVFLLYRYIGITMRGNLPGRIWVDECFFAQKYGPEECKVMSAMDAGIVGGILGGCAVQQELHFEKRLTEGCGSCRAIFAPRQPEVQEVG